MNTHFVTGVITAVLFLTVALAKSNESPSTGWRTGQGHLHDAAGPARTGTAAQYPGSAAALRQRNPAAALRWFGLLGHRVRPTHRPRAATGFSGDSTDYYTELRFILYKFLFAATEDCLDGAPEKSVLETQDCEERAARALDEDLKKLRKSISDGLIEARFF